MLPTKLQVNWHFISKEKAKKKFQDEGHGGYHGFSIGTILAIFDIQNTLMLPTKIQVN